MLEPLLFTVNGKHPLQAIHLSRPDAGPFRNDHLPLGLDEIMHIRTEEETHNPCGFINSCKLVVGFQSYPIESILCLETGVEFFKSA